MIIKPSQVCRKHIEIVFLVLYEPIFILFLLNESLFAQVLNLHFLVHKYTNGLIGVVVKLY